MPHGFTLKVHDGQQSKMLPENLRQPLRAEIEQTGRIHRHDLAEGLGEVWLPDALQRKYPNGAREFAWQYVFPAARICGRSAERLSAAAPS
jgi:hypothetical protein